MFITSLLLTSRTSVAYRKMQAGLGNTSCLKKIQFSCNVTWDEGSWGKKLSNTLLSTVPYFLYCVFFKTKFGWDCIFETWCIVWPSFVLEEVCNGLLVTAYVSLVLLLELVKSFFRPFSWDMHQALYKSSVLCLDYNPVIRHTRKK